MATKFLSRDLVVSVAFQMIDENGVGNFSVRQLASKLGAQVSSLYNHIRNEHDMSSASAYMNFRYVGDSNDDGKVNIKDATTVQKHLAELAALDAVSTDISDVDSDYRVTFKDATSIQKKIAGLI